MKKIVVLTGAGISAESGLKTFRDSGGLWEGVDVMEVASADGWKANPEKVLDFYNHRRKQALEAKPNEGHKALVDLEKKFDVTIVTQNVDNLHERAGSSKVIHLHGELDKARSETDENYIVELKGKPIKFGDTCPNNGQLRPHIVWFGEMVPMMEVAAEVTEQADILIVVGTSLVVYPAASLVNVVRPGTLIYVIDPVKPDMMFGNQVEFILESASTGTPKLVKKLMV